MGLLQLALEAHTVRAVQRLTRTYMTLSLSDIASRAQLKGAQEAEILVLRQAVSHSNCPPCRLYPVRASLCDGWFLAFCPRALHIQRELAKLAMSLVTAKRHSSQASPQRQLLPCYRPQVPVGCTRLSHTGAYTPACIPYWSFQHSLVQSTAYKCRGST